MTQKIINGLLALGLIAVAVFASLHGGAPSASPSQNVGTTSNITRYEHGVWWFDNTHYFGTTQQMSIDASGNLTTTGTITSTATTDSVNGITTTYLRNSSLTAATTTPCSLGPVTATSTLESFSFTKTAGTTTITTYALATSTSPSASTSVIATKGSTPAGAQLTFDWHPGSLNSLVYPGTYVNFTEAGGTGTFSDTGTCNAVLQSVN